ncbi:GFA family protein [Fretibacter rubidus]|uniref:GFA family protein n=1 Tax=Fretibacter rubidus TaxID=570162 RepID=UPI00352A67EC
MTAVIHTAGCHCDAVKFEFNAPATVSVTECNCSMCAMSGYQHVFIPQSDLRFICGQEELALYTFNSHKAQHLFCKTCGIKPLYVPRSHPDSYSVNLRCITPGTLSVEKRIAFDGQNWEANIASLKKET